MFDVRSPVVPPLASRNRCCDGDRVCRGGRRGGMPCRGGRAWPRPVGAGAERCDGCHGRVQERTLVPRDGSPRKRRQVRGNALQRVLREESRWKAVFHSKTRKVPSEGSPRVRVAPPAAAGRSHGGCLGAPRFLGTRLGPALVLFDDRVNVESPCRRPNVCGVRGADPSANAAHELLRRLGGTGERKRYGTRLADSAMLTSSSSEAASA